MATDTTKIKCATFKDLSHCELCTEEGLFGPFGTIKVVIAPDPIIVFSKAGGPMPVRFTRHVLGRRMPFTGRAPDQLYLAPQEPST